MSKMALLWMLLYWGFIGAAIVHPIYPLVAYVIFYYAPPHLNWWGDAIPDLRYSLTASFVLVGSILLTRSNLEDVKEEPNPARIWFLLFSVNTVIVTIGWAANTARSWGYSVLVLKLLLLYLLMPAAIRTPAQFDIFAASHVAGGFYWGWKAWDDPHRKAGRLMAVGGPDTQNDNQAAGHLLTVLPFAALFVLTEKRPIRRGLAVVASGFLVNVFVLCNSRGATLGLLAGGAASIFLAGKGRRARLIGVGIAGLTALLMLADTQFITRQQTTADPTDNSAQSRLEMWQAGLHLLRDHPLGAGGRAFHILSPHYIPDILAADNVEERSPHNTFVQLATDWGVQGFFFFIMFLIMSGVMLYRVRKRTPANTWYFYRSLTVQVALVATMAASFFSNRLYGESIYWMGALAVALHRIQSTELAKLPEGAVLEGPLAPVVTVSAPVAAALPSGRMRLAGPQ